MDGTGTANRARRVIVPTKLGAFDDTEHAVERRCLRSVTRKLTKRPDLVLVVAPAGYGKSTLLSQLRQRLVDMGTATGWVSLEKEDDDPLRFLAYLAAAASEAVPGLGDNALAQLDAGVVASSQSVFDTLLGDVAGAARKVVLFLDDYHLISNFEVHGLVRAILRLGPPRLRLVIASRSEPPLGVAELQSRGGIVEVGTSELSFQPEEARAFAERHGLGDLGDPELKQLCLRTEGWAVGMQLFFLAAKAERDLRELLAGFTGRDRDIADYLADAVLYRQPPRVREFLFATAGLDRVCAELSAEVVPGFNGQAMLEKVEAAGLFLIPLDRERRWFRYHHLFAEFLRARLERDQPGRLATLRSRASRWFSAKGLEEEGVKYAIEAEDFDFAAERIAAYAYDLVQRRGDHHTLLRWIDALPESCVDQWPAIRIGHAWSLTFTRDHEGAEAELARIDRLARGSSRAGSITSDEATQRADMIRCVLMALSHRYREARDMSSTWLERWPEAPPFNKGTVGNALGYACNSTFEFDLGLREMARAQTEFERCSSPYGVAWAMGIQGMLLTSTGDLVSARRVLEKAIAYSHETLGLRSHCASISSLLLSEVLYDQDELAGARHHVEQGMQAVREIGSAEFVIAGYTVASKLLLHDGDLGSARSLFEEGRRLGMLYAMPRVSLALALEEFSTLLRMHQVQKAESFAEQHGLMEQAAEIDPTDTELHQRARVRFLIGQGEGKAALALLNPLIAGWRSKRRNRFLMTGLLLKAGALGQWGAENEALRHLDQALRLGAEHRSIRRVADEGHLIIPLFARYLEMRASVPVSTADPVGAEYLGALAKALGLSRTEPGEQREEQDTPIERLSPKEVELLALVERGLSNQQIASTLFISEKTVKWHLHNVFGKLGVRNRTSAVSVARRLEMLP